MVRPSRGATARLIAATLSVCVSTSLWGQDEAGVVEQELLSVTEPFITLDKKLALSEGDGEVAVQVAARINPETDLETQPGGWWYYLEFEGEGGRYLTGLYKGPTLSEESTNFPEVRSYIPAGTQFVRIGVGAEGKTYQQATSLRVLRRSPRATPTSPLDGLRVADNTPRFVWDSSAQRVTVEVSRDPAFLDAGTMRLPVQMRHAVDMPQVLPPGIWHWRVVTIDGIASPSRSFEQTAPADADTTGPELDVRHQYIAEAQRPLVVKVRDGGGIRRVSFEAYGCVSTLRELAGGSASWAPPGGWHVGLTRVKVRAEDDHRNATERLVYVSHAEGTPAVTRWTRHEGARVQGQDKPSFPLAMYMVRDFEMSGARAAGFNTVQHYGADHSDNETTREWLQAADENGLKAFVAFDRSKLAAVDLDFVAERVAALLSEPGLMAWYLFDEPELPSHGVHPYKLRAIAGLIRALDPFHPIMLALYHEHFISQYRDCFDVHLTQAYHKDPRAVRREALLAGGLLADARRDGSLIVHNYIPFASFESNRCSAFLAAMYHNGVFWWGWWDDYFMGRFEQQGRAFHERFQGLDSKEQRREAFEKELTAITSELRTLEPVFTGPGERRVWEQGDVSLWLKTHAGAVWLIAANVGASQVDMITAPIPELRDIGVMQVQGRAEALGVQAGCVELRLGPHEVVVYKGRR